MTAAATLPPLHLPAIGTELYDPPGDPDQLDDLAGDLAAVSKGLGSVESAGRGAQRDLAAAWRAPSATAAGGDLDHVLGLVTDGQQATAGAVRALHAYAAALRLAKTQMATLRSDAANLTTSVARRAKAATDTATQASVLRDATADASDIAARHRAILATLDEAATTAQRELMNLAAGATSIGTTAIKNLDASGVKHGVEVMLLKQLPVLRDHPQWVDAVDWATHNDLLSTAKTTLGFARYLELAHDGLDTADAIDGLSAGGGAVTSALATAGDIVTLVGDGNPLDQFHTVKSGASYVGDVSKTVMDAGMTAFFIAPNPVTAGVVVVAGVVYVGSEIVAHWDDIERLANETGQVVDEAGAYVSQHLGDAEKAVTTGVHDVEKAAGNVASTVSHAAGAVGKALNPSHWF